MKGAMSWMSQFTIVLLSLAAMVPDQNPKSQAPIPKQILQMVNVLDRQFSLIHCVILISHLFEI
jgi:hypothetical protein